jgi:hypothetical protein
VGGLCYSSSVAGSSSLIFTCAEEIMSRPAVRAGLVGGLIGLVVSLIGLIPAVGCITLPLWLAAFLAAGGLAAHWMPPRRQTGPAAGAGAVAGVITGLISGLISVLLTPLSLSISGGPQAIISQLPPESLEAFEQVGVDPSLLFGAGTLAGVTALCCLPIGLVGGAALGALGGLIYAAAKPE